jgi:hypothetical protein
MKNNNINYKILEYKIECGVCERRMNFYNLEKINEHCNDPVNEGNNYHRMIVKQEDNLFGTYILLEKSEGVNWNHERLFSMKKYSGDLKNKLDKMSRGMDRNRFSGFDQISARSSAKSIEGKIEEGKWKGINEKELSDLIKAGIPIFDSENRNLLGTEKDFHTI